MLQIVATERGRRGSVDTHPRISSLTLHNGAVAT
jgi:hypothetical protein